MYIMENLEIKNLYRYIEHRIYRKFIKYADQFNNIQKDDYIVLELIDKDKTDNNVYINILKVTNVYYDHFQAQVYKLDRIFCKPGLYAYDDKYNILKDNQVLYIDFKGEINLTNFKLVPCKYYYNKYSKYYKYNIHHLSLKEKIKLSI